MARDSSNDSDYEYYVKWCGQAHADCTWEDGKLLSRYAAQLIEDYHNRVATKCIPSKNCPVSSSHNLSTWSYELKLVWN